MKKVVLTVLLSLSIRNVDSSVVSSSEGRLPMSLCLVTTDLEAEGVSFLATATMLQSQSVTLSERKNVLEIFDEEGLASMTTFGKINDEEVGVVIANPFSSCVNEVASTVLATHGSIILLVSKIDLEEREGEGLFNSLAPSIECFFKNEESNLEELIVVFLDTNDLEHSKELFEKYAKEMLSAYKIEDVFASTSYMTTEMVKESLIDKLTEGKLVTPEEASSKVYSSVESLSNNRAPAKMSSMDLASFSKAFAVQKQIIQKTLSKIQTQIADETLVKDFGALCDATILSSLKEFDALVGGIKSQKIKNLRFNIVEEVFYELEEVWESQLDELQLAHFELFRQQLSKLTLGPTLPQDMDSTSKTSIQQFKSDLKQISSSLCVLNPDTSALVSQYSNKLTTYCTERLQAARASGSYKPLPRKGVTVGLHWLLPKPFGNDYRLAASDIYRGEMVYTPKSKMSEISPDEVNSADWTNTIVPLPAGADMMYKPNN